MARTSAAPNKEILEAALQGLEAQKEKLEEQIAQVRALLGGRRGRAAQSSEGTVKPSGKSKSGPRTKRTLTAEARKRIAAAQKKRWAAFRKNQG